MSIEAPISSLGVLTIILAPHLMRQSISLVNISLASCNVQPRFINLSIAFFASCSGGFFILSFE